METFYTIPAFPGYGINRRGEVKSPTGVILTVTERGQVRVKKKWQGSLGVYWRPVGRRRSGRRHVSP